MSKAAPEVFFNRVPDSNFAGGATGIIFTKDPFRPERGRYETSDPKEIAELKAAIRVGAPTIYQESDEKPYAQPAIQQEAAQQQHEVDKANAEIEQRRKDAAEALANLNREGKGVSTTTPETQPNPEFHKHAPDPESPFHPQHQQQGVGGIVNSSTLAESGLSKESNSTNAARAAASSFVKK